MTKTYLCDPARNPTCTKALCFERGGPCGTTDDVRFALRDLTGSPVELVSENDENE
ncbi:MAG: hypothetical protein J6T26_08040 [Firmicutes bacterium]|nr:hypothetical protein [Bacillota bacterium]